MKISVLTLGCRTNQAESSLIEEELRLSGHEIVSSISEADIVIINSCSVTANADRQSRQLVAKARKANARVILTGCYAELGGAELAKEKDITVIGNEGKIDLAKHIPIDLNSHILPKNNFRRHRPIIKIQDGCDNKCSYCVIPFVRGKSRSVPPDDVLAQIARYEALGFQEVVLSGIHIGAYGLDLSYKMNLEILLNRIINETKINRIRLSSIELHEITEGILYLLKSGRLCNYFHIPLQGGNDKLLKLMNRKYTIEEFMRGLDRILSYDQNIGLGSDVIVGFPGETESDFEESIKNIAAMPLSYFHVFPFSKRPKTSASMMPGQINDAIKKARVRRMLALSSKKREEFISKNIGVKHDVIVESVKEGYLVGSTSNYIKVWAKNEMNSQPGRLAKIEVTQGFESWALGIQLNYL